jgi:hypothetical protein
MDAGETEGFPPGSRARVDRARDYLAVAGTVVRVVTDITIPELRDRLPAAPADPEAVARLADQWNLTGPVDRLTAALREH